MHSAVWNRHKRKITKEGKNYRCFPSKSQWRCSCFLRKHKFRGLNSEKRFCKKVSKSQILMLTNPTESKHCWVCFATEEDDTSASWASPCKCSGSTKWVHLSCLQRWIDEKQAGNGSVIVCCPQCKTAYDIIFLPKGIITKFCDLIDKFLNKLCPFVAGGILVGSFYWTAVTYGAVTVMQVLGHKEGLNVMEKADPLFLLVGLPTIPIMLILGRMIRWEDIVLKFWRRNSYKIPFLGFLFPFANTSSLPRVPTERGLNTDPLSITRVINGGLILPTIATLVGKLLFKHVNSNIQRTLLGGIAFVSLKGIVKIYYRQQEYLRQAFRDIKNYEEPSHTSQETPAADEERENR